MSSRATRPAGAGKSTLLRIIAGEDDAFQGGRTVDPGMKIGYLPQEPKLADDQTVLQNIEPALAPVRNMLKEYEEVSGMQVKKDLKTRFAGTEK